MSASMQPMYGTPSAGLYICYERVVMVKQPKGQASGPLGMFQGGAAFSARSTWMAGLLSYQADNLQSNTPSTSVYYSPGNPPLSLWGGAGSLLATDPFAITQVVNAVVTTGLNGRFNTSSASNGNWLESDSSFDVTLSTPQTAFGFYVMDLGDDGPGDSGAALEIDIFNGATLLETIVVPSVVPDAPSHDEAMWVGYENTGTPFDLVRVRIIQSALDPEDYDYVGFDDFTIGLHPPCTPASG